MTSAAAWVTLKINRQEWKRVTAADPLGLSPVFLQLVGTMREGDGSPRQNRGGPLDWLDGEVKDTVGGRWRSVTQDREAGGCREWTAARPLSSSTRTVGGPRIQKRNAETRFAFPLQSSIITQPCFHFTSGTGENGLGKRKGKTTIWATSLKKNPLSAYLSHTPNLKNDCAPIGSLSFFLFIYLSCIIIIYIIYVAPVQGNREDGCERLEVMRSSSGLGARAVLSVEQYYADRTTSAGWILAGYHFLFHQATVCRYGTQQMSSFYS